MLTLNRDKCMIHIALFPLINSFELFFIETNDLHALLAYLSQEKTTKRIERIHSKRKRTTYYPSHPIPVFVAYSCIMLYRNFIVDSCNNREIR